MINGSPLFLAFIICFELKGLILWVLFFSYLSALGGEGEGDAVGNKWRNQRKWFM